MALTSATNLQIKSMVNGGAASWSDPSSGYYRIGSLNDGSNHVVCLKFTIASAANGLKFSYTTASGATLDGFKWAITSSENSTYANATASTTGDGEIGMNTDNGSPPGYVNYTHKLFKTLSAGTYYLYLWTNKSNVVVSTQIQKTITISYGSYSDFVGELDLMNYVNGVINNYWVIEGNNQMTHAGYINTGYNWVTVFRFVTSTMVKNVTLSCCVYAPQTTSGASIRYKIVSGKEDASLANANSDTAADGTYTIGDFNDFTRISIPINKNISAGVHYLYLWTNKPSGTYNSLSIRYISSSSNTYYTYITHEETNAVIYVDNGTSFDAYEIYIDNGSSWDLYQAYIDNGSGWDECG